MYKLKKIITNIRIIILLAALVMAVFAISPNPWAEGVAIRSIEKNSSAAQAGIIPSSPQSTLMGKERITAMNNKPISNVADYYEFEKNLEKNKAVTIKTTKGLYKLYTKEINGTVDLGMRVYDAPTTNIRKGLDLQGGVRVLLQPEKNFSEMDLLIDNMRQRINVFGLSDVIIRESSDLSGNKYILVEVAGVNEEEVKELLAKQGKFEAKIQIKEVFKGGQDITYVCRSADCSGIDPAVGCGQIEGGWACRFRFSITLSPEAAARQAEATKNLAITGEGNERYLNETLDLYLDNQLTDSLSIGVDLKGREVTDIQISGSGTGLTQQEAITDALKNMRSLQTLLITGKLPAKIDVIQTDTVSPTLGEQFTKNALQIAGIAIVVVMLALVLIYRNLKIAIPIMLTVLFEIIILLGLSALLKRDIDLAAIAGIIAVVGTGVDQQIIITDEVLKGETRRVYTWKEKMNNAFFIIMGAYITLMVAMFPLIKAGAGLLKGFALITIMGATIGVFITRPAYAKIIEILMKE